jgi:hypothetical protein
VLGQRTGVSNTDESQRAPEGATPLRKREAGRVTMQVCTPTWQSVVRIRLEPRIRILGTGHDEPQ